MWKRSFVATSVALGESLDDALGALGTGDGPPAGVRLDDLVTGLRAPHRPARASALAGAIGEVVARIDEARLR